MQHTVIWSLIFQTPLHHVYQNPQIPLSCWPTRGCLFALGVPSTALPLLLDVAPPSLANEVWQARTSITWPCLLLQLSATYTPHPYLLSAHTHMQSWSTPVPLHILVHLPGLWTQPTPHYLCCCADNFSVPSSAHWAHLHSNVKLTCPVLCPIFYYPYFFSCFSAPIDYNLFEGKNGLHFSLYSRALNTSVHILNVRIMFVELMNKKTNKWTCTLSFNQENMTLVPCT